MIPPARVKVRVGGRTLSLSNLDKVLYPETGFTKGQVIDYYQRIAPALLPHLRDYPLTLKRYPSGVDREFFYEKRCPAHRPDWVPTEHVAEHAKPVDYCLIRDKAALAWVSNLATLELHTLLFRAGSRRPASMVFDLDPGAPADILDCAETALTLRGALAGVGLESFVKVSGGKGLHLHVPLNTAVTFARTKSFAHALAQAFEKEDPRKVTSQMKKTLRRGKVFIDWSQNDQHKTTVCPYSLRAHARPTVAAPITWKELQSALRRRDASALVFTPEQALRRVKRLGDLFAETEGMKQKLP